MFTILTKTQRTFFESRIAYDFTHYSGKDAFFCDCYSRGRVIIRVKARKLLSEDFSC